MLSANEQRKDLIADCIRERDEAQARLPHLASGRRFTGSRRGRANDEAGRVRREIAGWNEDIARIQKDAA